MELKEFITRLQDYYGQPYRRGELRNQVLDYLDTFQPEYLEALYKATLENFSGQFKTLPDIAVFEKLYPQVKDIMKNKHMRIERNERIAIADGTEENYKEEIAGMFKKLKTKWRG